MDWRQKQLQRAEQRNWLEKWGAGMRHQKAKARKLLNLETLELQVKTVKSGVRPHPVFHFIRGTFNPVKPPANDNIKPFASGYQFANALQKKGFEMIGSGNFSRVLAKKDSDKVIKVICQPDNWIDYVTWASKAGYAGTFAPKVYSYKKIGSFSVAVIERMDKTLSNVKAKEDMALVSSLVSYYGGSQNTMAGLFLEELAPGLAGFTKDLYEKFRHHLDLHNGNYMLRKDGTFCVTDPVYGASTNTHKRLKAGDFTSLAKAA